ncbi:MAG: nucleotidyltransferase domain-containing protein [Nanoarchaeota archaeon]
MSQKDYNKEIILDLLKAANHIRGLAKKLKTNQMMSSRKIKELERDNIVDYRQEGRNKIYFLKKTLEAQESAFIAEHYKLIQTAKEYPLLRNIILKIKAEPKIKLAVLFGSYAKGLAHKDSDIDIYIETTNQELKKEIEQLNTKASVKIGKYDPDSLLIKEIEKNHAIIKGIELYYEKKQFFA